MDKLVTMRYEMPMTDSRLLADEFGQAHRFTYELAVNHKEQLERFGVLRFETVKPKTGRPMNIVVFTEEQALMLLTYTRSRKETDDLRHKLITQFTAMKDYIQKQAVIRLAGIEVRRSLTDTVRDSGEVERMHGHAYSTYTRLAYSLTGLYPEYQEFKKTAGKDSTIKFRDSLEGVKLERLTTTETLIKALLSLEKEYGDIKTALEPLFKKKEIEK